MYISIYFSQIDRFINRFNRFNGIQCDSINQLRKLRNWVIDGTIKSIDSIIYSSSNQIPAGVIPFTIKSFIFDGEFNQELPVCVFPNSLESIVFSNKFNQPILSGLIPLNVKKVEFGIDFNQPLQNKSIPDHVEEVVFKGRFNQVLEKGWFPWNVKKIKFGSDFNQVIPKWMFNYPKLEWISFGELYNQKLEIPKEFYNQKPNCVQIPNYYDKSLLVVVKNPRKRKKEGLESIEKKSRIESEINLN